MFFARVELLDGRFFDLIELFQCDDGVVSGSLRLLVRNLMKVTKKFAALLAVASRYLCLFHATNLATFN
jgi:hypothetical protein